jgi:hypothetical protein
MTFERTYTLLMLFILPTLDTIAKTVGSRFLGLDSTLQIPHAFLVFLFLYFSVLLCFLCDGAEQVAPRLPPSQIRGGHLLACEALSRPDSSR